jgi:phosphate transport system protein
MDIRKHFLHQLDELRERVLYMGGLVETAVHHSLHAVTDRKPELADLVTEEIEPEINHLEVEIDERALQLMALQQPLAVDLRFVAAALKIGNDLERMGDLAVNIAKGAPRLLSQPLAAPLVDLPLMAERANRMLRSSLDALMNRNSELARAVLESDDEVDAMRDLIFRQLIQSMTQDPTLVERSLGLLFIARNLERIADHATNIAEEVIFWIEGIDVRHHFAEAPPT